jgi:Tol biopolymer transport system component
MHRSRHTYLLLTILLAVAVSACGQPQGLKWQSAKAVNLPADLPILWLDWSPDGNLITVARGYTNHTSGQLSIVNLADRSYSNVSNQYLYSQPKWSPEASALLMNGDDGLAILSYPEFQTGPRIQGLSADWSPTGEYLAIFHSGSPLRDWPSRLVVADLDGNILVELFEDPVERYDEFGGMDWSGSNNKIAFSYGSIASGDGIDLRRNIYLADPDIGKTRLLIDDETDKLSPSWSPDGEWLVYVARDEYGVRSSATIMFARHDGLCIVPGLSGNWLTGVDWSPDGTKLAVTHGHRLYVMEIDAALGTAYSDLDRLCKDE